MRKSPILKFAAAALLTVASASTAMAASDGNPGTTSTGTSVISVTLPQLIRIRQVSDHAFGSYAGTGDLNSNDTLNISMNYASGGYSVTGTGSGAASAFTITNGSQTIAYNVYFNDVTGNTGEAPLVSGTPLGSQTGGAVTLGATTLNANVHVEILEANLQNVNAGSYSGTLTLVVAP